MVTDIAPTTAATPHGIVPLSVTAPDVAAGIEAAVAARVSALLGRFPLLVISPTASGWPALPLLTVPEAGPQGGEGKASKAFTVGHDPAPTAIDASATLNVSLRLDLLAAGVVDALLRMAVVGEAETQLVAAIEAKAARPTWAAAHLQRSGGLFGPTLVLAPPGLLVSLGSAVPTFAAARRRARHQRSGHKGHGARPEHGRRSAARHEPDGGRTGRARQVGREPTVRERQREPERCCDSRRTLNPAQSPVVRARR